MTIGKILSVVTILSILMPAGYYGVSEVNAIMPFKAETETRHLEEDLFAKEKRLWHLQDNRPGEIEEITRLKIEIERLKRELGFDG